MGQEVPWIVHRRALLRRLDRGLGLRVPAFGLARGTLHDARTVHEDINPAMPIRHAIHHRLHRSAVGHIDGLGLSTLNTFGVILSRRFVDIDYDDGGPLLREAFRNSRSDPGTSTCHNGNLVF